MPRPSTLVILLSAIALYALGLSAALPAGIVLAMGLEMFAWKRAADRAREMRLARVARPVSRMRGRR